jgi:hypothetical protein
MPIYNLSERTLALLPQLIAAQGINVPILRAEETKTLVRLYLYGHRQPVVIRKPSAGTRRRKTTKRKPVQTKEGTHQEE